jgi:hypothetical protein
MSRTPRPRVYEYRVEANTTKEQSDAIDLAFAGNLIDRAAKLRLLIGMGLQSMGIVTAAPRPAQPANGHHAAVPHG